LRGEIDADRDRHWQRVVELQEQIERDTEALMARVDQPEVAALLVDFLDAYRYGFGTLKSAQDYYVDTGSADTADAMVMVIMQDNARLLQEAADQLAAQAQAESRSVGTSTRSLVGLSVALLALSVALGFVLFLILVERGVLRPIRLALRWLVRLCGGSFSWPR